MSYLVGKRKMEKKPAVSANGFRSGIAEGVEMGLAHDVEGAVGHDTGRVDRSGETDDGGFLVFLPRFQDDELSVLVSDQDPAIDHQGRTPDVGESVMLPVFLPGFSVETVDPSRVVR